MKESVISHTKGRGGGDDFGSMRGINVIVSNSINMPVCQKHFKGHEWLLVHNHFKLPWMLAHFANEGDEVISFECKALLPTLGKKGVDVIISV